MLQLTFIINRYWNQKILHTFLNTVVITCTVHILGTFKKQLGKDYDISTTSTPGITYSICCTYCIITLMHILKKVWKCSQELASSWTTHNICSAPWYWTSSNLLKFSCLKGSLSWDLWPLFFPIWTHLWHSMESNFSNLKQISLQKQTCFRLLTRTLGLSNMSILTQYSIFNMSTRLIKNVLCHACHYIFYFFY